MTPRCGSPLVRPLLFVDIDGVLNPYGSNCPDGFTKHWLFTQDEAPVRVCAPHGEWLQELAERYDLMWASAWSAEERKVLARVLPLPEFHGAVDLPRGHVDSGLKVPGIDLLAAGRSAAWVDDMLTPVAWQWTPGRGYPTRLIPVDPNVGLQHQHVLQLAAWASTLTHPA